MTYHRQTKSIKIALLYEEKLREKFLKADSLVGSVRALARQYGISTSTADKVLSILVERDILYRRRGSGTFIKHDLPMKLMIGFTGVDFNPADTDEFQKIHACCLQAAFAAEGLEPCFISYSTLINPDTAHTAFAGLDALLLSESYIDDRTVPQLESFPGPVVIINSNALEDRLLASQVLPDYEVILKKLEPELRKFKRILILSANHLNASILEKKIRKILSGMHIETITIESPIAQLNAYKFFLNYRTGYEETLILSLSGYITLGLRDAFANSPLPAVMEFDNLEKYRLDSEHDGAITAIDPMLETCYSEAVQLVKQLVEKKDSSRHIVMVRPGLTVRKSFVPILC